MRRAVAGEVAVLAGAVAVVAAGAATRAARQAAKDARADDFVDEGLQDGDAGRDDDGCAFDAGRGEKGVST